MSDKADDTKAFGMALSKYLDQYGKSRSAVASEMGATRSYISQLTTGAKAVSAEKVDSLADTIGLSEAERIELHRAAAKSAGFRIDLPEGF
jgi:transcriptional regulator with XRE-family HTH domain